METTRLDKIEAMLEDEPADVFLRYSRAMELAKLEREEEAVEQLRELIRDSRHVPSYFMAGQQLARRGIVDEARAVLREGIEQARLQNDSHAAGEMSEFLTSLGSGGARNSS